MSVTHQAPPAATTLCEASITSIQPGGGTGMAIELAWGRLRRWWLRTIRPGYVRRMAGLRQGECPNCPHDIIDPRDLKYYLNVCGYWFRPEDDSFRWRERLWLARAGFVELLLLSVSMAILAGVLSAGLVFGLPPWIATPLMGILALLWLQGVLFFRDPERAISADPAVLVSPADGTITEIGEVEAPEFPGGRALRIGIFLSIFNVHVNRSPRQARVLKVRYYPGKFGHAGKPPCPQVNEQLWVDLEDVATGRTLRVKQIAGAVARRIVCWLKPGDTVQAGERFGMIKFGSRTEVYLPLDAPVKIEAQIGQAVKGGSTVLLRFAE
jgi:phosphatidylserine decarboxylase